jgi:hypothetical protein
MADETLSIEIAARDLTGQAFADVRRQLEGLNQTSAQTAKSVGELAGGAEKMSGLFKGAGIVAAVGAAANAMVQYHQATRVAAAQIADQAEALQKTTAQFQAYVFAGDQVGVSQDRMVATLSRFQMKLGEAAGGSKGAIEAFDRLGVKILDVTGRLRDENVVLAEAAAALLRMGNANERAAAAKDLLGVSGARLIPLLEQLSTGFGDVMDRAERAGTIIDDKAVQAANRLQNQSNQTSLAVRAFYANIGMPIELKFLEAVERTVKGITSAYLAANDAVLKFAAAGGAAELDSKIAKLDTKIANAQDSLDNPSGIVKWMRSDRSAQVIRDDIAAMKAEREQLEAQKGEIAEKYRQYRAGREGTDLGRQMGVMDYPPDTGAGGSNPTTKSTGGAGGGTRDRIQEAINQLVGQRHAAEQALQRMMAGAGIPMKDLEQQVALEKKIADELAKLGKYDPKDPRVQQIRDQVTAHEQAESALKRWTAAARDAEEIERRSGDGSAYLRTEMQRLNEALDTGRLSYEAYGEAARQAKEKADDMRLQMRGQQGGIDGMLAGMESAANQWSRSNNAFTLGQKAMNDGFDLLRRTGDEWAQSGVLNFEKFKAAGLNMILQLGLAFAQSELMKWIKGGASGGVGGSGGGIFDGILNMFGGGGGGISAVGGGFDLGGAASLPGGFMPGFAGGGETPVNRPFWVGERGPELMQLGSPARVYNQDQMAGMGGGPQVTVPLTVMMGSVVSRAEMEREMAMMEQRVQKAAIAGVAEQRRTSSSYRRAFRG